MGGDGKGDQHPGLANRIDTYTLCPGGYRTVDAWHRGLVKRFVIINEKHVIISPR